VATANKSKSTFGKGGAKPPLPLEKSKGTSAKLKPLRSQTPLFQKYIWLHLFQRWIKGG
jgi:hypothetical protein